MSWPRASTKSTEPPPSSLLGLVAREFMAQVAEASFAGCRDDPVRFVLECFEWREDEGPTPYQLEVLRELPERKRVALRGPHGLGKTALAAWVVLWFALTRDEMPGDWKVVSTASVWRQLSHYLWPEIHKWARRIRWDVVGRGPFDQRTELLQLVLKLSRGEAFAAASDKPESIEGAHASHLLYVFDEAKAIPPPTWDAAEGALAGGDCYALAISTPGEPQGRFYEIHSRKPGYGDWWTHHVKLEECIAAGRIDAEWARQRVQQWGCTFEMIDQADAQTDLERQLGMRVLKATATFSNRALGEFASSEEDGIIPLAWVEAANERWAALEASGEWDELTCVGVDVAGSGEDRTVLAMRHSDAIRELRPSSRQDTMQTTGAVMMALAGSSAYAIVDVIGIGAGVVDRLRELSANVQPFNAGEHTDWRDVSRALQFANLRSAAWWNMRELLDPAQGHSIALPPDDMLTGDLTAPRWRMSSGGKILLESKDDIRKRIGRSTDDGDAVIMSFWTTMAMVGGFLA